jgi:hypothetical protein
MIRELNKLPDSSLYRGFGMSATYNTKEKVVAEASRHLSRQTVGVEAAIDTNIANHDIVWIESMAMAFVKEEEE